MKIELIKKTMAISGREYYYVSADGSMQNDTWTTDYEQAQKSLLEVTELAKKFPVTVTEILQTVEI